MRCCALLMSAVLLVLVLASGATADPIEWSTASGGNGHYYESVAVLEGCSWVDALAASESSYWMGQQGYLATVTSAGENNWIWTNLGQPFQYRIGALQPAGSPEPSGGWTWLTGEPWSFTNWHPNEPNNGGDLHDESTIEFHESGQWNDIHQIDLRPGYVVEFDAPASAIEPNSWSRIKAAFRLRSEA